MALEIKAIPTRFILISLVAVVALLLAGCTGNSSQTAEKRKKPQDTVYTQQAAMMVYDYDPVRALKIIDSAVLVGNVNEVRGDFFRARIYSWSCMGPAVDSLLGGPEGVRFDQARAICERLLLHDSLKTNVGLHQDVLEVLVYVARQQQDTTRWLRWSEELVDVCHRQGPDAEPEALRTEAEIGGALCLMGQRERGMARIDSVLTILDSREHRQFNWLDATVIALKRKLVALSESGEIVRTIPLARRINERLDDYERHPDLYHDGSYREPEDSVRRADYIGFYRSQAQSFITAAYAKLGEQRCMSEVYDLIEQSVRETMACEHIARYEALEHKMRLQEEKRHSQLMTIVAMVSVVSLLLILFFATYIYFQSRRIRLKNQVLIRQINQSLGEEPVSSHEPAVAEPSVETDDTSPIFQAIDQCIRTERLYADANIQRQDICDRFNLRREVLNQLLTKHASGLSFPNYINGIRLTEACRLLKHEPTKTVAAIADEVGLSPRYLRRLFVERHGVTPTEYRAGLENE